MEYISESTKDLLNSIPLLDVLKEHGYKPSRKDSHGYWYSCPFHADGSPSFHVYRRNVGELQIWKCHGCGKSGKGAIDLEMALEGTTDKSGDFIEVCKSLSNKFSIPIQKEEDSNEEPSSPIIAEVAPQEHFSLQAKQMSMEACKALGLKTTYEFDEHGEFVGDTCSWGDGFEADMLERDFCLKNVDYIIYPKTLKQNSDNQYVSWKANGTALSPIVAFDYTDKNKVGYWRIYRPAQNASNFGKFLHYPKQHGKEFDIKCEMWGDAEFMTAWKTGVVTSTDNSPAVELNEDEPDETPFAEELLGNDLLKHPVVMIEKKRGKKVINRAMKFEKLIICSGPRDGINAYYHSTAHVCWTTSETFIINAAMWARLKKIAHNIYICYDIDRTGIRCMNEIALKFLELKVVYLPSNLSDVENPRTKKPCKDLSDYLCYYPTSKYGNKREMLASLLGGAAPMQFWEKSSGKRVYDDDGERWKWRFELLPASIAQFAQARGFSFYQPKVNDANGQLGEFYFHVKDNIVSMIETKNIAQEVKKDMLEYLKEHQYYNDTPLRNTIIQSKRMMQDTLFVMEPNNTSFISWGKDFCYFFFKNTAVRVSADEMVCVRYSDLPFYVNERAIIPHDFNWDGIGFFDIAYNQETIDKLRKVKQEHLKALKDKGMLTPQSEHIENERMEKLERLWKYKLLLNKKMNDMPPAFQVVYDTGRIYWEKEKEGIVLTEEERQRQDMYFISKCLSIGYMLHPFRDPTRIYAVVSTDYNFQPGVANGRNMKSFIGGQLIPLVRKALVVGGKNINTKPEKFAENFASYELTEHSYMYLDDLKTQLDVEVLFNTGSIISKRKLYKDAVQITGQWVPKIMMSTNNPKVFNMSSSSQYERIWMQPHSNYYHAEDERGRFSSFNPMIKFGRNIIEDITEEERQQTMWWLMKCCQLYIRENRDHFEDVIVRIDPDTKKQQERLSDIIRDNDMILFFQEYFADKRHYRRPIARKELVLQYELYKLQRNEGVVLDHIVGISRESLSVKSVSRFCRCLKAYCESLPYEQRVVVNPESLFGGESRWRQEGIVSRQAWVSVLDSAYSESMVGYDPAQKREKRINERCFYFYRISDIPQSKEDVWTCGEIDPEEAMSEEKKQNEEGEET